MQPARPDREPRCPFRVLAVVVACAIGVALWPERAPRDLLAAAREAAALHANRVHERRYVILVDFERAVVRKRLWVVDATSGATVLAAHVSHGIGSGDLHATRFDGGAGSGESLVGAFVTGEEYRGRWGRSMRVDGLEDRNALCRKRAIVFHAQWPPLWSRGCFTTRRSVNERIIDLTRGGSFLYVRG